MLVIAVLLADRFGGGQVPGEGRPLEHTMAKSYRVGWDTIMPDPGKVGSWDCRVCGAGCDVERGVVGRTSSISPRERAHDSFTCPNAGEPWHDEALRIRMAAADMPAPSVRAMMDADADRLVEERG